MLNNANAANLFKTGDLIPYIFEDMRATASHKFLAAGMGLRAGNKKTTLWQENSTWLKYRRDSIARWQSDITLKYHDPIMFVDLENKTCNLNIRVRLKIANCKIKIGFLRIRTILIYIVEKVDGYEVFFYTFLTKFWKLITKNILLRKVIKINNRCKAFYYI